MVASLPRLHPHPLLLAVAFGCTLAVVVPSSARAQSDHTLHFVLEPISPIEVNETFAVHVEVRDSVGSPDGGFSADIQVTLLDADPALLSGTKALKVDLDGVARFVDLSITEAGSFRIVATGGAAEADTSGTLVVEASATAIALAFDQQPITTEAGAAIAVKVRAIDALGITDPSFTGDITIAIGINPAGGTLSGTLIVAAVGGVATFGDLSINRTGTGYTLTASASLPDATSNAFAITAGPASGATSLITASPTSVPADGASPSTITVELHDALGNPLTTGGDAVELSTTAGSLGPVAPGNGTYTATLTAPSAESTATISGTVNGDPITNTADVTFTAVAPVATHLEFGQQPTDAQAGQSISPPITVRAADDSGITDPSFTGDITIAIGINPAAGTLSGTMIVAAVAGVATFGNLSIDNAGSGYTLDASASGLIGDTSATFDVTAVAPVATALAFDQQPISTQAGAAIAVMVRAVDAGGATVTSFADSITIAIGTNPAGGTLSGTMIVAAVAGVATFDNLSIDMAGSGYTLDASASGLIGDTSAAFDVTAVPPVATRLEFGQQPTNIAAGAAISPAVTVRAVDSGGATVTSFTGDITIAIGNNPAAGTLSGTMVVAAVAGVATFGNLSINRSAPGYTLAASANGLAGATSTGFTINPGPPSGATSQITAAPTSVPADGASTSTITVELRDAFGNRRISGGPTVVLGTTAGTLGPVTDNGDGTYTAALTAPLAAATATISGTINGAAITDTATVTFTTVPPNTNRLLFVQQPTNAQAGATLAPAVSVRIADPGGATVTSFTGNVTIAIAVNPAGGTLSGTSTVFAVAGVATYSFLSIDRAGTGYRLAVGASLITSATSDPFNIATGPASGATTQITAAPTSILADGTSTSTITVEVRDALDNQRTTGGDQVVLVTTIGTLGAVTDLANGTYIATLRSAITPGTATISGTVAGAPITDTATVAFTSVGTPTTRLVFGQQPSNAQAGAAISPAVTVRAVDNGGATVTTFTGNVVVAIGTNPAGGTLSGATTVAAVAGVATFGNLSINRSGTGYTLAASASGPTGATSNAFAITPGPASGATSQITAVPTSIPANGTSTSTITVELRDALGNRRTTGGDVVALVTTPGVLGTVTDLGNGTYTASLRSSTTPATATVSGTVNGAAILDTASVEFTSAAAVTDLAVTASVDDATPAIGGMVVYTIRATNQGSERATGVEVSYELSDRLAFVSSVPSQGTYSPQLEVWAVGILEAGEGATLQITARVVR
jgi:uncharacterized Zn ribbon protein